LKVDSFIDCLLQEKLLDLTQAKTEDGASPETLPIPVTNSFFDKDF
jgi:hypothetical protein